jgi:hypothetical protein
MNTIMKFEPAIVNGVLTDNRCRICRHHKFIVLSESGGVFAMHTHLQMVRGESFPYISREQGIHWWGEGVGGRAPECLLSYTKTGGKKE